MSSQNITWVRYPVTWGIIPGWEDTIWSIKVMAPGLVSEGLIIGLPECFPLVLHGLLWDFPNRKITQGESFMTLLIFLVIITLLDNMRRDLKEQQLSLWRQIRTPLSPCPQRSSVYHILDMSSLVRSATTEFLSTSSKLVGICNGLLVGVMRSYTVFRLSSWL